MRNSTAKCGPSSLTELAFKGMVINRKKTGELFWAQQTITSMRDESGHLTHFVSVSQDITELRKKQEQEFQLQLARDVQQRFYAAAPVIAGFDIAASAHPADETGGDYFDFISMADGSLLIAWPMPKGMASAPPWSWRSPGPTCAASLLCSWISMTFSLESTRCF